MRCCTVQLANDLIWVGNGLIKYYVKVLMMEVLAHRLLAIATKDHQFDVMKIAVQLQLSCQQEGFVLHLIVNGCQSAYPSADTRLADTEIGYCFLRNFEENLVILAIIAKLALNLVFEVLELMGSLDVRVV